MSLLQILKQMVLHRWLSLKTSDFFELRVTANILKWLALLYFLAMFCYMGYMFDVLLGELAPESDSVVMVNSYIVVGLLLQIAVRFFVQKLPVAEMQPYLTVPLKKSRLVKAWLFLSFVNWWTVVPVAFLLPFWFKIIKHQFSSPGSVCWLLGLGALVLVSNLAVILLKALLFDKPLRFLLLALVLAITFWFGKNLNLQLASDFSNSLFEGLLSMDIFYLACLVVVLGVFYTWTSRLVRQKLYLDYA